MPKMAKMLIRIPVKGYIEYDIERDPRLGNVFRSPTEEEVDTVLAAGDFILEDHDPLGITLTRI